MLGEAQPVPEPAPPDLLRTPWQRLFDRLRGAPGLSLARFAILRLVGLVYFFAFLSLARQVLPLIGSHGLLPVGPYLERVAASYGSPGAAFLRLPSLFWLGHSDGLLVVCAYLGVALSFLVLAGFANAIVMAALWTLYLSFVHIGQLWYGYGWEIQLCETGFYAIFLCPLLDYRPFPRNAPPRVAVWLFRWLIFRIMLGAGLIKMRGDPCWRDLTCLYHHYETQPIPNPLSRVLHFMPHWFHNLGVLYNHLCELVCPVFVFGPRFARHVAGVLLLGFQTFLILSGNLSFLNWLTIVPILACFDDGFLGRLMPRRARVAAARAEPPLLAQRLGATVLAGVVAVLSIPVVDNLLSPEQRMNTSYNPIALVNTYGAFGSVGDERHEIVFEGTSDPVIGPDSKWNEYSFRCKPGDVHRRPCIMSPYHDRIDWQIWFAAMTTPERAPWTVHLVWKLLHNDAGALSLLDGNPFPAAPPRHIRAWLYRYEFAPLGESAWWRRTLLDEWLPPLAIDDLRLRRFLAAYGWLDADD